jgi:tRNA1Val (adenine37-N6)-methyltransferase
MFRMDDVTQDSFFDGRIRLKQHRSGYRYSIDAVLLASAVHPKPQETLVDLGTGCGIIPLILAFRRPSIRIWGVELQPELAKVAEANIRENGMASQVTILHADMRDIRSQLFGTAVDTVVSNPPYRDGRSGRVNPNEQRALARHELTITLPEIVRVSRRLLRTGGRLIMIYTASRIADLFWHLRAERIEPKRMRLIYSHAGSDARLVLIEGVKDAGPGVAVSAPLIVYAGPGGYSEEVQAMFTSGLAPDPQSNI